MAAGGDFRGYPLYTAEQVRELDRLAIAGGIAGFDLMQRAGRALLTVLFEYWPGVRRILVLTGPGNNGGDGYVLAALARQQGLAVTVLETAPAERIRGEAHQARELAREAGVPMQGCELQVLDEALRELDPGRDVVLDAMLGTGVKGDLRTPHDAIIPRLNAAALPVLAVDVPSGLQSDTGAVASDAVIARITATFIGRKQGLYTGTGPRYCGEVVFDDLQAGSAIAAAGEPGIDLTPAAHLLDRRAVMPVLGPRRRDAHKGDCGHVLVIGGDLGYGGAALMSAEAAARSGAGLTSLLTRSCHVPAVLARRPEIMVRAVEDSDPRSLRQVLDPLLAKADAIVLGPGLGDGGWGRLLLGHVLDWHERHGVPLVLDADALNMASTEADMAARESWVLTPHPGEAARLLGWATADIQADRFAAVCQLQQRYGGVSLLKGVGSLICYPPGSGRAIDVCGEGNPGMASGGMGDVLSGLIAALVAQGLSLPEAVRCGACVHGASADLAAADDGERGLLATDLLAFMRTLLAEGNP